MQYLSRSNESLPTQASRRQLSMSFAPVLLAESAAPFMTKLQSPRLHCAAALEYGLEYRIVSEPCISLHLVAALNPPSFSMMQPLAGRGCRSAPPFNPKVVV